MIKNYLLSIILVCSMAFTMQGQTQVNAGSNTSITCGKTKQLKASISWIKLSSGTNVNLNSVYFTSKNTGFAIGDSGTILKTTDAGATWIKKSPVKYDAECLKSICFVNKDTGYVIGTESIRKTTDGGETWIHKAGLGGNCIYMTSSGTGFAGTQNGIATITDGDSMSVYISFNYTNINAFAFITPKLGYAVGDNGTVLKTSNDGSYWEVKGIATTTNLYAIHFNDSINGYIDGETSVFKTKNGGESWSTSTTSLAGGKSIFMTSNTSVYICSKTGVLYRYTGTGWAKEITPSSIQLNSVLFLDSNTGYTVGNHGQIFKYEENGTFEWSPATGLSATDIANPIASPTTTTDYIVTYTSPDKTLSKDTVTITVTPATINAGADQTVRCGETAQLGVTTNYTGSETLKYKWTPSIGLNNDSIANPVASPITTTIYTVTVTTPGGCSSSDQINITVQPLTVNAGTDQSIHCGETAQLGVTTNYAGTQKLKYKWTPSTGLSNDTIVNPVATITANTTYTVTVTTPNGCTSSDDVQVSFTPMSAPSLGIVTANSLNNNVLAWIRPSSTTIDSICVYKETNVTNVYKKIGSVAYAAPNQFVDSLSQTNVQSNKYKISVKDHCGLESVLSDPHKTMHLSINQGVNNTWNLIWEAYTGFTVSTYNIYRGTNSQNIALINSTSGSNTQFTDLTAPSGNVYYQIEVMSPYSIFVDKITTAQNTASLLKSASTSPALYYSSRSNVATNNTAGIATTNTSDLFTVYPNPAKENIQVSVNSQNGDEMTLNIFSATGSLVKSERVEQARQTYDISSLNNGIYILELKSGKITDKKRLIINK